MRTFLRNTHALFSPPHFLTMSGMGVDVGAHSVKAVQFSGTAPYAELHFFKNIPLEKPVIFEGDIENKEALVEVLRSLRLKSRAHYVHASLLEKKAYLYQTIIPAGVADPRLAVEFSLEQYVPLPPKEALFDFEEVRRVHSGVVVSVSVYARRIIEAYVEVFERAGMTLRSIEVELQALARAALTEKDRDEVVMIVDFGKKHTRIGICDHGVVSFTATIDVGGDALTSAIIKYFSVDEAEAEKMKNERGFIGGAENSEFYEALMLTASVLRDEIGRHMTFWNSPDEGDIPRAPVSKIILVGGNANMKGLPEFLSTSLNVSVVVGALWHRAFSTDRFIPEMRYKNSLQYGTAIGLALRSALHIW